MMKTAFSRRLLAVLLVAAMCLSVMPAMVFAEETTVNFDFKGNPWNHALGSGSGATADAGNVTELKADDSTTTISFSGGGTPTRMWTGPQLRIYNGASAKITAPSGKLISKIVVTATGSNYLKISNTDFSSSGSSSTANLSTPVADYTINLNGNGRWTNIAVTLVDGGTDVPTCEHTYSEEWTCTPSQHYHAATCEHTELKKDEGAHAFDDNGVCVCGYAKPTSTSDIVNAAYELAEGESLVGDYTLSGHVIRIDKAYDTNFSNVTVTIVVDGLTEKPIKCYRMKGDAAADVKEHDNITVTGKIMNYSGTVEFDSGCTLDARAAGTKEEPQKDATCKESGRQAGVYCESCKKWVTGGEEIAVNPNAHTAAEELKDVKEATCTVKGYSGDKVCKDCGAVMEAGHETELAEHQIVWGTEKDENGMLHGECSVCHDTSFTKPYCDHTNKKDVEMKPATCTEEGHQAGVYCDDCSEWVSGGEVIAKKDHTVETVNQKPATCGADGYTGDKVCSVCHTELEKGTVIEKLDHTWGDWTVTKEATETEMGKKERTCSACNQTETEDIAKLTPAASGQITSLDKLTTGTYVIVLENGNALGEYDNGSSPWITVVNPVIADGKVSDAKGGVWTITVNADGTVKLTDPNGVTIAPKGGNNNGIKKGDYSWKIECKDGKFTFNGVGDDTVLVASNTGSENKFRAYKTTTAADAEKYPSQFLIYACKATEQNPGTDNPGTDNPGTGETEEPFQKPTTPAEIVKAAFELGKGETLPEGPYTLTGVVSKVGTYNEKYKDVTIEFTVEGKTIQCYALKSGDADNSKVAVGDTVTVTGTIKNYNGTVEFDKPTLDKRVPGENPGTGETEDPTTPTTPTEPSNPTNPTEPENPTTPTDPQINNSQTAIVDKLYALGKDEKLENQTLTGTITKINTPYSEQYKNVTVTIVVKGREDKPVMCYRLKGGEELKVGDVITVTGTLTNYMGNTYEFTSGATYKLGAPATGDNSFVVLCGVLMALSVAGAAVLVAGKKKLDI